MMHLKNSTKWFISETTNQCNHSSICARHWGPCRLRLPAAAQASSQCHRCLFLHTSHSSRPIHPTTSLIPAAFLQLNLEIHHNQSLSPTVRFSALHNSRRLTRTLHIRVRWAECLYSLLWDDILAPESCFFRKAGVTSYISSSPGRVVPGPLVGFHSQLKRCQKSTRAPFDIGPFSPAEETTGALVL